MNPLKDWPDIDKAHYLRSVNLFSAVKNLLSAKLIAELGAFIIVAPALRGLRFRPDTAGKPDPLITTTKPRLRGCDRQYPIGMAFSWRI